MKKIILLIGIVLMASSCQKEKFEAGKTAKESLVTHIKALQADTWRHQRPGYNAKMHGDHAIKTLKVRKEVDYTSEDTGKDYMVVFYEYQDVFLNKYQDVEYFEKGINGEYVGTYIYIPYSSDNKMVSSLYKEIEEWEKGFNPLFEW